MDFSASCIDTSLDLNFNPSHRQVLHDDKKLLLAAATAPLKTSFFDLAWKPPVKDEKAGELAEELKRVNEENKKLTEMLTVLCENYNALRSRLTDYMNRNPETKEPTSSSKKRKSESSLNNNQINNNGIIVGMSESSSTNEDSSSKKIKADENIKAKVSRVYVQTEASDTTLAVKDGYQWRKYGQKVTRDNPCPRAYFKCSFAPSCPVKKKVQRSVEDQSVLVATYEGEHNHPHPVQLEGASGSNTGTSMTLGGSVPSKTSLQATSGPPSVTLDLTKPKATVPEAKSSSPQKLNKPELQHFFVEQMASSLTNDPNFTAALAAAISGKMLNQTTMEKWL